MSNLIAPSKALGYSNIFLDFLADDPSVRSFYPAEGVSEVTSVVDSVAYDRDAICEILVRQNRLYGVREETFHNIEKLREPGAVCVFAGQQAGLFGGPMLVVYKALSLAKAADLYARQLGRPVVPVFWIAGDDHDFDEVNHTWVLSGTADLSRISYDTLPAEESPVSEIRLSDIAELERAKSDLKDSLGERDFTTGLYELLDRAYTSDDTFVSAFGKLMADLTAGFGLVFFSPGDADVKRLASGLFRQIVDKGDELQSRLDDTNRSIADSGYHLQVEKSPDAAHLFYNVGGRKPVRRDGARYRVGEKTLSREELLELLEDHPERFSPDVMTRPVLQSYLFPVVSQKGGAAEIAYLAQINQIFDLFSLPVPFYRARPSITILEKRFEQLMNEHEIRFEELTGDIEQIINRVLAKTFPDDIEAEFKDFSRHLKEHFRQFTDRTLRYDPGLGKLAEQTLGKIDYTVKGFEAKVFSSHKKRSQETRDRIYRLWHSVYPNRNFQERSLNITYFLSKYGRGFIQFLYDAMDSEQKAHQLIHMSEYNG